MKANRTTGIRTVLPMSLRTVSLQRLYLVITIKVIYLTWFDITELAHQWFGNLVTMDWWNELWLNEGFATWVGWLAVDHFYPGESKCTTTPPIMSGSF